MKKITPVLLSLTLIFLLLSCVPPCGADVSVSVETKKTAAEYRNKGLAVQRDGDLDTALMYYQKSVELDPTLAIAYNDIGVVYEAKGWNDRAIQAYAKAVELDPTLSSPYYNLGVLYEKQGDLDKAAYFFKQRVLIGDWNDEWTAKARQELKSLGVGDPEIQEDYLDQHLARVAADEDLGNVEPRGNDLDPRTRKRNARLHLMRGKQLYAMGRLNEAIMELGIAVTLDPKNKEIKKTLEEVNSKVLATQ